MVRSNPPSRLGRIMAVTVTVEPAGPYTVGQEITVKVKGAGPVAGTPARQLTLNLAGSIEDGGVLIAWQADPVPVDVPGVPSKPAEVVRVDSAVWNGGAAAVIRSTTGQGTNEVTLKVAIP